VAAVLYKNALTNAFKPSGYTMIAGDRLTLDFDFTTTGGPSTIEWYLEFAKNPAKGPWRRELAEEDGGKGNVLMPEVVRTFATNNATALADGPHGYSSQFRRQEAFARIQARITAGACTQFNVSDPFGSQPTAPAV
jgi:hypothetical protein